MINPKWFWALGLGFGSVLNTALMMADDIFGSDAGGPRFLRLQRDKMSFDFQEEVSVDVESARLVEFLHVIFDSLKQKVSDVENGTRKLISNKPTRGSRFQQVREKDRSIFFDVESLHSWCDSADSCSSASEFLNLCSASQATALEVYDTINQVVHTTAMVIELTCGCVYILTTEVCVLSKVMIICGFPYKVFNTFTGITSSAYNAVDNLTKICGYMPIPLALPKWD